MTTTAYVTIPTIELVRRELCAHPTGTLIETTVRSLAKTIRRSAGLISVILRQLESDGWITHLTDARDACRGAAQRSAN